MLLPSLRTGRRRSSIACARPAPSSMHRRAEPFPSRRERTAERSAWHRRLPVGAELAPDGGVHFRVWAPRRRRVEVVLEDEPGRERAPALLDAEPGGYFSGSVPEAGAGAALPLPPRRRRDALPRPGLALPARGPHGPSQVVDPAAFRWTDGDWRGVALAGQVHLRDARRHLHAGGHLGGGRARAARAGRRSASPARGHAGRRLPRPLRLGLRRRQPLRPDAALRHARRLPPLRRPRPTPSASA